MLRAALAFAQKGLCIFPCQVGGKTPATPRGCKDASKDPDMIRHWWGLDPHYNIALATGTPSGVFAVDIDGLDGAAALRKLEATHGELPPTVTVTTGRGVHLYFQMPDVPVANSVSKIAPGIDVRGDGGYTILPPSVHPSGRRYCWSVDSARGSVPAPAWLLDSITAPANSTLAATPASEWRALFENGVPEGRRNATVTRLAGHLLRRFVDPIVVAQLLHAFNETQCVPPLASTDIDRIVESIAGRELIRRNGRDRAE